MRFARSDDGAVRVELEVSLRARNERDWVRQRFELEGRMAPDGVARWQGCRPGHPDRRNF